MQILYLMIGILYTLLSWLYFSKAVNQTDPMTLDFMMAGTLLILGFCYVLYSILAGNHSH